MPNDLEDLVISETSLVDRPANSSTSKDGKRTPHAVVALWKRDTDVEKYSTNQGRDGGKWKSGGGVGKEQHAAENADTPDAHQAASKHHQLQALDLQKTPDAMAAHSLASKAHQRAAETPSKLHSRTARNLSQAAGNFSVAKEEIAKDGKTEDGKVFPRSDYAYTPDDVPSHWKLRLTSTPGGAPDTAIVGAAAAALGPGGHRGEPVQLPADARASVVSRVRAAWRKVNPDKKDSEMPEGISKGEGMAEVLSIEQIQKKQEELDAVVLAMKADTDALKAENVVLKAENELVLKMSKGERKAFGSMSAEKRKAYMAAGDDERKTMMDEECKNMEKARKAKSGKEPDGAETGDSDESMQKIAKVEADFKKQLDEVVAKQGDVITKLTAQVTKSDGELTEIKKRERLLIFTKRAEDELPHIGGKPEEKGALLMKVADAMGEDSPEFKAYMDTQKAADKIISRDFREIGKHGGGSDAGDPMGVLNAKAVEIAKRDGVTKEVAFAKAIKENPDVYEKHVQEHPARA